MIGANCIYASIPIVANDRQWTSQVFSLENWSSAVDGILSIRFKLKDLNNDLTLPHNHAVAVA
jgi:hypothetical protein